MNIQPEQAVYRLRKSTRRGENPKEYRGTLEVVDERTQTVRASCDLVGRAVFGTHDILDGGARTWQITANRKLAPSRWTVRDPEQRIAMQFDQKTFAKLTNPLYRVSLVLLDDADRERYRLVDPRKNVADLILGVEDVCVLRISIAILNSQGAVITDQNAASKYVRFLGFGQWRILDFDDIYARDWKHPDDQIREWRHKSRKCAEVLVPHRVPPGMLLGAYAVDDASIGFRKQRWAGWLRCESGSSSKRSGASS
ncbi:DarT ssDNA thymidine ADP-ribosyltransferase family protein [Piscinibacter sp.]|uniref:DarT ssDNA thymidine ADP-ribosyltransferase family protein n=1 Tax=Piscinibacter sp. TaxID=1903157 RepID=UPI002CA344CF|nr:DarT ssDNA thymidine ADP-ribosyltransferase family protein [Albitalea sp.]HUG25291.1 DarT ssDNA thymidine ADP-ribosyltransferase family protein [Albitalea sp.]